MPEIYSVQKILPNLVLLGYKRYFILYRFHKNYIINLLAFSLEYKAKNKTKHTNITSYIIQYTENVTIKAAFMQ